MQHYNSIDQFKSGLEANRPLICIDYGAATIGISISDRSRVFAIPYISLKSKNSGIVVDEVIKIINEKNICGIVVGYPVENSGKVGNACKAVEEFTEKLVKKIENIPCFYQDERLSTKLAQTLLRDTTLDRRQRDKVDDQLSACNILQTTLDMLRV